MKTNETHRATVLIQEKRKSGKGGFFYKVKYMDRLEPTFSGHFADDSVIDQSTFARAQLDGDEFEVGSFVTLSFGTKLDPRFGKIQAVLGLVK